MLSGSNFLAVDQLPRLGAIGHALRALEEPAGGGAVVAVFAELQHGERVADPHPMETSPLDPSLPGVRLLQAWIREQLPISVDVIGSERIEGRLIWQDPEFLAIERHASARPTLVNRRQISVIRSLG